MYIGRGRRIYTGIGVQFTLEPKVLAFMTNWILIIVIVVIVSVVTALKKTKKKPDFKEAC